jgi:hypothetical protein
VPRCWLTGPLPSRTDPSRSSRRHGEWEHTCEPRFPGPSCWPTPGSSCCGRAGLLRTEDWGPLAGWLTEHVRPTSLAVRPGASFYFGRLTISFVFWDGLALLCWPGPSSVLPVTLPLTGQGLPYAVVRSLSLVSLSSHYSISFPNAVPVPHPQICADSKSEQPTLFLYSSGRFPDFFCLPSPLAPCLDRYCPGLGYLILSCSRSSLRQVRLFQSPGRRHHTYQLLPPSFFRRHMCVVIPPKPCFDTLKRSCAASNNH